MEPPNERRLQILSIKYPCSHENIIKVLIKSQILANKKSNFFYSKGKPKKKNIFIGYGDDGLFSSVLECKTH